MKDNFLVGLEIEGIFNQNFFKYPVGSYHNGEKINKYWKVERDGSLRKDFIFQREICAEFVSSLIKSRRGFISSIRNFKSLFPKKELNKLMYFNKSCGCHFHIGFYCGKDKKERQYNKLLEPGRILRFRRIFFKRLNELNINEEAKKKIKKHYFRSFALRSTKNNFFTNARYKEFNLYSERQGQGLEWRSFNLRGVDNWADFEKLLILCYDLLHQYFFTRLNRGYKVREKNLKFNIPYYNKEENIKICVT